MSGKDPLDRTGALSDGTSNPASGWSRRRADGVDWTYLYQAHAPSLRRLIARRLPRGGPVEDVLQETFVRAIRSTPLIDTARPAWPFLATVAGRAVADWWSEEARRQEAGGPADRLGDDFPGSEEHASVLDRAIGARRALRSLPVRHRRVLFLYEGVGSSYGELVEIERSTPTALKSLLARARAGFRAHYRDAVPGAVAWARVLTARVRDRYARYAQWQGVVPVEGLSAVGGVVVLTVAVFAVTLSTNQGDSPLTARRDVARVSERGGDATSPVAGATRVHASGAWRRPLDAPSHEIGRRAPVERLPTARLPISGGAGVANTDETATASYRLTITIPIGPTEHTIGTETRCDRGFVAAHKCAALRALPGSG